MRLALALFLACGCASAQWLSFGVRAGAPATDVFEAASVRSGSFHYDGDHGRYLIGPAVELRLPFRLSVELDALYRSVKYRTESRDIAGAGSNLLATGNAWQFPLLAKYRLSRRAVAPFVAAGVSFNRLGDIKHVGEIITLRQLTPLVTQTEPYESDTPARTDTGYVIGVGLEGRLPLIRLTPELRYTFYKDTPALGPALERRNQLEALIGISF